jgi:hypothetical protein
MPRLRLLLLGSAVLLACNDPDRPIVPVDEATTLRVYELELIALKKQLTTQDSSPGAVHWENQMYLNPYILLPPADSANPLRHNDAWLNSMVSRGLVQGVCGEAPDPACPEDVPIAFTSLGVPWTRGGDTVFVGGGYTGLVPNQPTSDAVFWLFTMVKSDTGWAVKGRSTPNYMTFTDSAQ